MAFLVRAVVSVDCWPRNRADEARGRFLAAKDAKSAKGVVEGRGPFIIKLC